MAYKPTKSYLIRLKQKLQSLLKKKETVYDFPQFSIDSINDSSITEKNIDKIILVEAIKAIKIEGWIFDNQYNRKTDQLYITIGTKQFRCELGIPRHDLVEAYSSDAADSGFRAFIALQDIETTQTTLSVGIKINFAGEKEYQFRKDILSLMITPILCEFKKAPLNSSYEKWQYRNRLTTKVTDFTPSPPKVTYPKFLPGDEEKVPLPLIRNNLCAKLDLKKRPLKILSVSHNLSPQGAPYVKLALDQHLNNQPNIDINVISPNKGPLQRIYANLNIPVEIVTPKYNTNYSKYTDFIIQFSNYIRDEKYDLVYANTLDTFWAIDAAHAAQIPSIWHIHESVNLDTYYWHLNFKIAERAKAAFLKANRTLFVCHATAQMFAAFDYYRTADVIHNGISIEKFSDILQVAPAFLKEKLKLPLNKKIVSIIGTTCQRKGQLDFVKAAVEILKNRNDVCFLIVGAIPGKYLEDIRSIIADSTDIILIDETPDVAQYFRVSDIFVCASYEESFPMVILEAMAFSLPIVTTPVFGIREQITEHTNGLFFEPGDVKTMASKINEIINNQAYGQKLGQTAFKHLTTKFRADVMLDRYLELCQVVSVEDVNECSVDFHHAGSFQNSKED